MFTTVQFVEKIISYSTVKLLEAQTYQLTGLLMVIPCQYQEATEGLLLESTLSITTWSLQKYLNKLKHSLKIRNIK